jgi:hypothetical protein
MARIMVDADFLTMAMEDNSGHCEHYLDKKTGNIIMKSYDFDDMEAPGEEVTLSELLEREPDRFVYVDSMPSHDAYRIMEDFVGSLPDGEEKRLLEKVLSWKKPFSNFKSALYDMEPVRQQWFEFHEKRMWREAQKWIEDSGLDAELAGRKPRA